MEQPVSAAAAGDEEELEEAAGPRESEQKEWEERGWAARS